MSVGIPAYMDRAVDFKVNKPWYKIRSRHALNAESGGINGEPTKSVLAEGEVARDEIVRILSEKVSAIIAAEQSE
jgi:creatinine amidohydrolase